MSDKEKIIKGLEECAGNGNCTKCQYGKEKQTLSCKKLLADALALLKEQEPILLENQHKPHGISTNANSPWVSRCPRCGKKVEGKQTRFCAKGIEINAEHTCEIIELFKRLREVSGNECY